MGYAFVIIYFFRNLDIIVFECNEFLQKPAKKKAQKLLIICPLIGMQNFEWLLDWKLKLTFFLFLKTKFPLKVGDRNSGHFPVIASNALLILSA